MGPSVQMSEPKGKISHSDHLRCSHFSHLKDMGAERGSFRVSLLASNEQTSCLSLSSSCDHRYVLAMHSDSLQKTKSKTKTKNYSDVFSCRVQCFSKLHFKVSFLIILNWLHTINAFAHFPSLI